MNPYRSNIGRSDHTHLLVFNTGNDVISRSIQLLAGRTAREHNQRKNQQGAFWQDRYHATAVESDRHLIKCLNMVRAGVVAHPAEWPFVGYNEIQKPPERYRLIDRRKLRNLVGIENDRRLRKSHRSWIESELKNGKSFRDGIWTESIATGSNAFVAIAKQKLKSKAIGRKIIEKDDAFTLRESQRAYNAVFAAKSVNLKVDNSFRWKINPYI